MDRAVTMVEGIVNFFITVVEVMLGLRFLFKFLGANADNGFVQWLYDNTDVLLDPFRGIFPVRVIEGDFVVEFSTLFAMLVYALVGFLIWALVANLAPARPAVKARR